MREHLVMNVKAEVFRTLAEFYEAGTPCVSVTLIGAKGSIPQEVGAKMVVAMHGRVCGTIGGGRVEEAAIRHAQGLLRSGVSVAFEQMEWNLQQDIGMTCGGLVTVAFECFQPSAWVIAIFGAGHVAQALVRVLAALDCRIFVYDTRDDLLERLYQGVNVITQSLTSVEDAVKNIPQNAFVIVMTQGHRTDKPILERILKTRNFPYLGVIGSKSKASVLRRELRDAGVTADLDAVLRCPIGLPIGKNTPEEIAISIAAELLQVRDA